MIHPIFLICIPISIVHMCIGASVFLKAPRDRTNQAFFLATFALALWIFFHSVSSLDWQQLATRTILTRFAYATGALITGAVALFCMIFLNRGNLPRRSIAITLLGCAFLLMLALVPGAVHKGFRMGDAGVIEIHGSFRTPYYLMEAAMFALGLWHLWRRHKLVLFREEKFQLRLIGAAIFVPAFASLFALGVVSRFWTGSIILAAIPPISTVAFIFLAGYAISRHGLFNEMDLALEYMFNSVPTGICVTQIDGRIIRHNKKLIEMVGYEGELVGRPMDKFLAYLESQITLPLQENKCFDVTVSRLTSNKDLRIGNVYMFHDVTERKMLKDEIRGSEEKYHMLVENASDIIYTVDLQGNFTFINKACENITGYNVEEWIGRNFRELLVPGEEEKVLRHAREAYKGNTQWYEVKASHKSGNILTLWNIINTVSANEEVVGFSVIARDITKTKELERQLRESEEKYRTLVEDSENVVYVVQDGRIVFLNKTGFELSGYTEEEVYSNTLDLYQTIHPEDRLLVAEAFTVLAHTPAVSKRLEARFMSKKGEVADFMLTGTSLTYRGKPAIIGVIVDITEKKRLREQLIQSDKLASIGELVSGVAHELNNPLTAIMGYSQLFCEGEGLSQNQHVIAGKIAEASERCKRIIENLLSFAKKSDIRREPVDVREILDKAIELREYNLTAHNIKVQRSYHGEAQITVGDAQQLQGVFLNLINNACDAMYQRNKQGVLAITTRAEGEDIIIEFMDDGPGIPSELRDKVFDPFFTTKEVGKGTGLGLSISYGIIQEHGGELSLDSAFSDGAKFIVRLPASGSIEQDGSNGDTAITFSSHEEPERRILVVDDEETIRDLSVDILTSMGHKVDTACNGANAREMIGSNNYDLIIADIRMPGALSGIDLYRWTEGARPALKDRIVFVTGDILADDTRKFLEETKKPCLSKPFEISDYMGIVRKILAQATESVN